MSVGGACRRHPPASRRRRRAPSAAGPRPPPRSRGTPRRRSASGPQQAHAAHAHRTLFARLVEEACWRGGVRLLVLEKRSVLSKKKRAWAARSARHTRAQKRVWRKAFLRWRDGVRVPVLLRNACSCATECVCSCAAAAAAQSRNPASRRRVRAAGSARTAAPAG